MNAHRFYTIMFPTRGTVTAPGARAIALTGTTVDHFSLATLFPDNWKDGQYFTIKASQDFYMQSSTGATDDIATTVPGDPITEEAVKFESDIEYSGLFNKGDTHLHVIGAAAGTMWIWKSSSSHI